MTTARHIVTMLKSHIAGDEDRFLSSEMQLAAHGARPGHGKLKPRATKRREPRLVAERNGYSAHFAIVARCIAISGRGARPTLPSEMRSASSRSADDGRKSHTSNGSTR